MPRKKFDLIVFDWDGTLMDSTAAIVKCIQGAAKDLGLPVPSDTSAAHVIGLGLSEALQTRRCIRAWPSAIATIS
jgi:phosphoglycolate phosphatase